MAILFDDGASQYLGIASAVLTATPITMACWMYCDDAGAEQDVMTLVETTNYYRFQLTARGDAVGDRIRAQIESAGGFTHAETSAGYSVNTWHPICAVFTSNVSRAVYIDGGNKGTDTTDRTPSGIDKTFIAAISGAGDFFSGRVAEAAFWNAAFTDEDVALHATGVPPWKIRPSNLVACYPLNVAAMIHDIIGGYNMTAYNAPVTAEHPPVATLGGPIYVEYEVAAPPAGNPWYVYAQMQ